MKNSPGVSDDSAIRETGRDGTDMVSFDTITRERGNPLSISVDVEGVVGSHHLKIGHWRVVGGLLAEHLSTILVLAFESFSQKRVERLQLSARVVEARHQLCDHPTEALNRICRL